MQVQTVLGPIDVDALGRTLMHEHVFVCFPGAEFDPDAPYDRRKVADEAVKRITELRERCKVTTFVDPCPIETGRDVELMREVSQRTGMNIICATGFYTEDMGIPPYWRKHSAAEIARLYIRELQQGVGNTGIRAGLIKVATGAPQITPLEARLVEAACMAHHATKAPILTHTNDGVMGPEQQALFRAGGVDLSRCLIGHSCANPDLNYHLKIAQGGSYVGFDRIGKVREQTDEVRAANLAQLIRRGFAGSAMISQDCMCAFRGKLVTLTPADQLAMSGASGPRPMTHLFDVFIPMLKELGIGENVLKVLLEDNPRRFFAGEPIAHGLDIDVFEALEP